MTTLHSLATEVVTKYDTRLRDEVAALAFFQAVENLRAGLAQGLEKTDRPPAAHPDTLPIELQAMLHVSKVLGSLSESARFRALVLIALSMAPDIFSRDEYTALVTRAKKG